MYMYWFGIEPYSLVSQDLPEFIDCSSAGGTLGICVED